MRNDNRHTTPLISGWVAPLAIFTLIALLAPAATAQDAEPTAPPEAEAVDAAAPTPSTGPLHFVGSTRNAPYSFLDREGLPTGYDVAVMNAIAERLRRSVTIELKDTGVLAAVAEGAADGVIGLGIARGRENPEAAWALCGPTVVREYRIAVTGDSDWLAEQATHRELNGLRIAIGRNDPVAGLFEANRSITLEQVNSPMAACELVHARRVRAFVADQNTIQYAARERHDTGLRMIGSQFYRVESYGPAVPVDAEPGLATSIRSAVAALERDGVLAKLQTKWFAYEVNAKSYTRLIQIVAAAVGGAAILAAIIYAWALTLRRTVIGRTRKLHAELEVLRKHVADLQTGGRSADAEPEPAEETPMDEPQFEPEPADINTLVEHSLPTLQKLMGRRFRLALDFADQLPPALVDPIRVERMLIQLCNNARDAVDKQRESHPETPLAVTIATRMANASEKPANIGDDHEAFVAISVRDHGCGIRQEMVQRIFHRGYTTKPNAAGRGLTFVYETVAEHGGWIDVESAAGRGAAFSIFLPASGE